MSVAGLRQLRFSASVLEQLRKAVLDGYTVSRFGGVEVGGVLFGRRESDALVISELRRVGCEHAFGPRFILSPSDEAKLVRQLESAASEPALHPLTLAGWYCSHTRGDLLLTGQDLEFFNWFFPSAGSLTVVLKPENAVSTAAAVHMRRADGTVNQHATEPFLVSSLPSHDLTLDLRHWIEPSQHFYEAFQSVTPVAPPAASPVHSAPAPVNGLPKAVDEEAAKSHPAEPHVEAKPGEADLVEPAALRAPDWAEPVAIEAQERAVAEPVEAEHPFAPAMTQSVPLAPELSAPEPETGHGSPDEVVPAALSHSQKRARRLSRTQRVAVLVALALVAAALIWNYFRPSTEDGGRMALQLAPEGDRVAVRWTDGPARATAAELTLRQGGQTEVMALANVYAPNGVVLITPKAQRIDVTLTVHGAKRAATAHTAYTLPTPLPTPAGAQGSGGVAPPAAIAPATRQASSPADDEQTELERLRMENQRLEDLLKGNPTGSTGATPAPKPRKAVPRRKNPW